MYIQSICMYIMNSNVIALHFDAEKSGIYFLFHGENRTPHKNNNL